LKPPYQTWAPVLALVAIAGCKRQSETPPAPQPADEVTVTMLGTNDLHGAMDRLPPLAGYVDIVRQRRKADGGAVLLVSAGDMFQGTMESNLNEGAAVIRAFNAMGYDAAAIGNHDFDFGAVGPDDRLLDEPQGALKARARQANFLLLAANLVAKSSGKPLDWEGVAPSTIVEKAGLSIGVIGVASETLDRIVRADLFTGIETSDLVAAIEREARALRSRGVAAVVVLAHAGGRCTEFGRPDDFSSCQSNGEIFRAARRLSPGLVDVIVAGHDHSGIAHLVNGVAIVEAYSRGRAFSRVDLRFRDGKLIDRMIYPPRDVCPTQTRPDSDAGCEPGSYDEATVEPSADIAELIAADLEAARTINEQSLGVVAKDAIARAQTEESPLGNFIVDLMLAAHPEADLALNNGGALRADLPAGLITYGRLYEAMAFDNVFATMRLRVGDLERDLERAFTIERDVVSVAGARILARCRGGRIDVSIEVDGTELDESATVQLVTSDYLATGGDGLFSPETRRSSRIELDHGLMIRDAMALRLRQRGGMIESASLYDPGRPRLVYPAPAPVTCAARPTSGN